MGRKNRKRSESEKEKTPATPIDPDIDEGAVSIFRALGAAAEEEMGRGESVGYSTLAGYVGVVVDLWTEQLKWRQYGSTSSTRRGQSDCRHRKQFPRLPNYRYLSDTWSSD